MMIPRDERLSRLFRRSRPGPGVFARTQDPYVSGNTLSILENGARAFSAMLEAIDSARQSIHMESYIFGVGAIGREFIRRLSAKARQKISVRLIYDSMGSLGADQAALLNLRMAGGRILEYHPIAPWRPRWSWWRRDHRKILIIDDREAFVGSVNISDDHQPASAGGAGWRDLHFRVKGPAAREINRLFQSVWVRETGDSFEIPNDRAQDVGPASVWVAANQEFLHRTRIRSAYLRAVRAARKEILIAHSYFLPGRRLRAALAAASRRGVDVKILVPGQLDVSAVWLAARSRYDYMLRHGARLFEWTGPMLHEKAAVVDGTWSAVGSYNMDRRSLLHNLEVNLHVLDPEFSARLAAILSADMRQSRELKLDSWRKRPATEKLLERAFFQLRYFL
ncbi:MAG: phospholipase D-like domain-containing protein [Elusimicrobiota bacterium]